MVDSQQMIEECVQILEHSPNRAELEAAAIALASSDDPAALDRLGEFLRRPDFLARLDDLTDPQATTLHLKSVMSPLAKRPSPEVAGLCLALSQDPNFLDLPDRLDFLLLALAAVKPMSEPTASLFRDTNEQGYYSFNGPLLAKNASPRALELLESMIEDRSVPIPRRIDCLHSTIVPNRTTLALLEMCDRLLSHDIEDDIRIGVIESVFDYQGKPWFGPHAPIPPGWRTASVEVLRFVLHLAEIAKAQAGLADPLRAAIDQTIHSINAILARRAA